MPPIPVYAVLTANTILVLGYLVFGIFVMPVMRKRKQQESEATRAELLSRYRAERARADRRRDDQEDQSDDGRGSNEDWVAGVRVSVRPEDPRVDARAVHREAEIAEQVEHQIHPADQQRLEEQAVDDVLGQVASEGFLGTVISHAADCEEKKVIAELAADDRVILSEAKDPDGNNTIPDSTSDEAQSGEILRGSAPQDDTGKQEERLAGRLADDLQGRVILSEGKDSDGARIASGETPSDAHSEGILRGSSPQYDNDGVDSSDAAPVQSSDDAFQTRVLNDRLDVEDDGGPGTLTAVEAPASEYSRGRYFFRAITMLLCPVVGPLFFVLSWVFKSTLFRKPVDVADVIFSKARVKPIEEADPEHEMNITPLEEAVSITDSHHLRTLMLNVLSGEMSASLSSISEALSSDDSESAHYAASYLSDAVNQLRADTQKLYLQILEDEQVSERVVDYAIDHAQEDGRTQVEESDRDYVRRVLLTDECSRYIEMVDAALNQRVFTRLETEELARNLQRVAEIFYEAAPNSMQPEHYEAVAHWLNEVDCREEADSWLERESYYYSGTLSYHTCRLKILYSRGNRDDFFDALDELKNSSVTVDKATLDAIRLFEREVA